MLVTGIGHAIVDVICRVDDAFLVQNNLVKSTLKIVDENEFTRLLSSLEPQQTIAGGSVANSIVGLSNLGNKVGFIGKISTDELGDSYKESLIKENVTFYSTNLSDDTPTGTCLILITPDSERTMCTFLGISGTISPDDIYSDIIQDTDIIFLEGYLWDEGDAKTAFNKTLRLANKSVMSLSDQFCVERHKSSFLDLVKYHLDITFANEQEIMTLIDASSFEDVIEFGKTLNKLLVITRGDKGSVAIYKSDIVTCQSQKHLNIVDLTGAGDLFAAGFLHGYIHEMSLAESLGKGTELASIIIQKYGARIS